MNTIPLLQFEHLKNDTNILHFISTRQGGVSEKPYDSLNLGLGTADNSELVILNRQILAQTLGIGATQICIPKQTHSNWAAIVEKDFLENSTLNFHQQNIDADALLTTQKNICLMVLSADCVMILLYDKVKQIIGAVHAGWRGSVHKILENTVLKMIQDFGSKPEDILVGIAPHIAVKDYEIGEEVENAILENFGTTEKFLQKNTKTNKFHLDLLYINQKQLWDLGIPPKNIQAIELSTFSNPDLFFSARRDKHITGRFGAGIMLR